MASALQEQWRKRLQVFYQHYQPEKASGIEAILRKVGGVEERFEGLLEKLVEKYGPEPVTEKESSPVDLNEALAQRIRLFYQHYNESKLDTVEDLVMRTKNKPKYEERLMRMLQKKYGPEPAVKAPPVDPKEEFRQRLLRFYATYQPSKISSVEALVAKADGVDSQEQLFRMLIAKYGPEPVTETVESDDDSDMEATQGGKGSLLKSVTYCPIDGMPPEYCEYLPSFEETLPWLLLNFPDLKLATKDDKTVKEYTAELNNSDEPEEKKKKDNRGGKARPNKNMNKKTKGGKPVPTKITIERTSRSKRKYITVVIGLDGFDVKLKEAAKKLGKRCACSASVNKLPGGGQSVDIQGDVCYELPDLLLEYFPSVEKDKIYRIEDGRETKVY